MYTSSSMFLKALADLGITHVFVNWGSDHPALLEELQRQRVSNSSGETTLKIITSPNEMVALSAAQGFAQATGRIAAVIVHVDVGTQALAGAIHNVDRGRVPVLIYAGASPYSLSGEHRGSRNEWIHWMQDVPDQPAILRQYMRFTGQIQSGLTAPQTVARALHATSAPKGPSYIWARREVSEEEVSQSVLERPAPRAVALQSSALPPSAVAAILDALVSAKNPLLITSHLGRNPKAVDALLSLVDNILPVRVFSTCPSSINIPYSNRCFAGIAYLQPGTQTKHLSEADGILLIDVELPWIAMNAQPSECARIFLLDDGDPFKRGLGSYAVDAELVCSVSAEVALTQIVEAAELRLVAHTESENAALLARWTQYEEEHHRKITQLVQAEQAHGSLPQVLSFVRQCIEGLDALVLNEGISNYPVVWNHLRADKPGSLITSGGSALGWSLGAAIGASLGTEGERDLIVSVVGDGSFLFCVPSSAFWMARRYTTPFLTIVLNNGGWRSPKLSMLAVHHSGFGSQQVSGDTLSVGFGPDAPDYAGIAVAATGGWAYGKRVNATEPESVKQTIAEAVKVVVEERRCAVVDVVLEKI